MSEETTERLNDGNSFETRVLTALAAINGQLGSINVRLTSVETRLTALEQKVDAMDARLTAVEQRVGALEVRFTTLEQKVDALDGKVDARLRETRPIWEGVLARLDMIDSKLDVFALEIMEMRGEINLIKKRLPPAA